MTSRRVRVRLCRISTGCRDARKKATRKGVVSSAWWCWSMPRSLISTCCPEVIKVVLIAPKSKTNNKARYCLVSTWAIRHTLYCLKEIPESSTAWSENRKCWVSVLNQSATIEVTLRSIHPKSRDVTLIWVNLTRCISLFVNSYYGNQLKWNLWKRFSKPVFFW